MMKAGDGTILFCARRPMRHNLKIEPRWLPPVIEGRKKAEIRRADRDFSEGDELLLYAPDRSMGEIVIVTHVLPLAEVPGCEGDSFVSLSIEPRRRLSAEDLTAELEMGSFG
jgi:hypothetical protein